MPSEEKKKDEKTPKVEEKKKVNPCVIVLAVIGAIAAVAAIAYAVFYFFTPEDSEYYEDFDSGECIFYDVDNSGWRKTNYYIASYPSCSPSEAPTFEILTYSSGATYLKWGRWDITNFPVYMEELTYIQVLVGTQAKIQIGKPHAFGAYIANSIYDASDLIQQEKFAAAKQKL